MSVGGEVVTDPARDVDENSGVTVDGREVAPEPRELFAVNKPKGVVSTAQDTHGRPVVIDLVQSDRRLYPVGRLDVDTTGLILLTNDGELAERLTHPRYGVEKTYRATVHPPNVSEPLAARDARGSGARGRPHRARPREHAPGRGELEIVLREGRKHQVRTDVRGRGPQGDRPGARGLRTAAAGTPQQGDSRRLTAADEERLRGAASGCQSAD